MKPEEFALASRRSHRANSVVDVHGVAVGGVAPVFCAGPCSVETPEQILACAEAAKRCGANLFRAGAYKPRTSPYSFQGLGEEGLKLLAEVRIETGLGIVTEAIDTETFDLVEEYADCVQIGARNMQNFSLLRRAGRSMRPVLLKRGLCATLEEFLLAAEYVLAGGNSRVILCERGVRTFTDHSRTTLDLSIVPAVKRLSHLPIIVDPSHATGARDSVPAMSLAAIAAGAHGLLIEMHVQPNLALTDGPQAIYPSQLERIVADSASIAAIVAQSNLAQPL